MKTRIYIIGLLLSLALGQEVLAGYYGFDENYEKTLVKEKKFAFSADKTLKISNQRGSVTIKNWDKPQVSVTVKLLSSIILERDFKRLLKNTELQISDDNWSFSTRNTKEVEDDDEETVAHNHSLMSRGRDGLFSFEYTIYAPKNIKIDLDTKFGDIAIESMRNDSKIKAKFATIQVNNIVKNNGNPLKINVEFGTDVQLPYVPNLEVKAKFSEFDIKKVDKIKAYIKFTGFEIAGKIPNVLINSQHCNLSFESVDDFESEKLKFTKLEIEDLQKNLILDEVNFGEIEIENVAPNFEKIAINAHFTPIRINAENANYDFELETKYGKVKVSENVVISTKEAERHSLYLKGTKKGKGKKGNVKVINKHAKIIIK